MSVKIKPTNCKDRLFAKLEPLKNFQLYGMLISKCGFEIILWCMTYMTCTCTCIQDILVTQSEYVKGELIHLRQNLQNLEDRAGNIETDIRNAMSEGSPAHWVCVHNHSHRLVCFRAHLCRRQRAGGELDAGVVWDPQQEEWADKKTNGAEFHVCDMWNVSLSDYKINVSPPYTTQQRKGRRFGEKTILHQPWIATPYGDTRLAM